MYLFDEGQNLVLVPSLASIAEIVAGHCGLLG